MGLEPTRYLSTRPSNVPVCQFQHVRIYKRYYTAYSHKRKDVFDILSPLFLFFHKMKVGGLFMAYSDRELIARIVQCEAGGEGENGMKAVASVIMNRVNVPVGEYSRVSQRGSIRNIIFQPGQFDCVRETLRNQYNPQNIYNMTPTEIHYNIADWAMAGNRLNEIGECLWYLNPFRPSCGSTFPSNGSGTFHTRLGDHCFYRPTSSYSNT